MKIMQQFLSKGLLFVIAFIAALAYFKRAELWPQWFAPQAETQTQVASTAAPEKSESAPAPLGGSTIDAVPANPQPDAAGTAMDAAPAPATNFAADTNAAVSSSMNEPPQAQVDASPESSPESAPVTSSAPVPESAQSEPPAAPETSGASDQNAPAPDAATLLQEARSAYWAHDFEAAERLYHQLAGLMPDDADPLGELGNLYYTEGRWNDAATAYEGAVQRLMTQGDVERGEYVLMVLEGLDPMRADKLRKELHVGGGT